MSDTTQNLAAVTSSLATLFRPEVERQANREATTLRLLPIVPGRSQTINVAVENTGMVAESFTDGADVSNFGSDSNAPAALGYGNYRANFHVSTKAQAAAFATGNPAELMDLQARNTVNAGAALAKLINQAIFTGTGSSETMVGLATAISSTGTYAGIDRSSSSYWRSYKVDPGSATALSLAQIRLDIATIKTNSGRRPEFAIVGPLTRNSVVGLFDSGHKYISDVRTARGVTTLESGSEAIIVEGCQFVEDVDCPEGSIYYMNSNYIRLETLPQPNGWFQREVPANDGFGILMKGFALSELAKLGASRRWTVESYIQLVVSRPNAFGRRLNVAY